MSASLGIFFAIATFVFFVLFMAACGVIDDTQNELKALKAQAVERNYAAYDAKTGEWGWR